MSMHAADLRGKHPAGHSGLADALLDLSESFLRRGEIETASLHLAEAREWGIAHDAREVLCRSALVQSRIAMAKASCTSEPGAVGESLANGRALLIATTHGRRSGAAAAIDEGVRIARDCGFGIYHVDLLLKRARLQLCLRDPLAALADIRVALDDGIPADDKKGQLELLAATHDDCGYAWGIAVGLHLRGEALLLQAAIIADQCSIIEDRAQLPPSAQHFVDEAEANLNEALQRWQLLHDPAPCNENFVHPTTGVEYNYRAAETYHVLESLARGHMPRNFLVGQPLAGDTSLRGPVSNPEQAMPEKKKVFVSHSSVDKPFVRHLAAELRARDVQVWLDEEAIEVGDSITQGISAGLMQADYLLVVLSKTSVQSAWVQGELNAAIMEEASGKGIAVLPALIDDCDVPILLRDRIYADFRKDFEAGLKGLLRVFRQESETARSVEPGHCLAFNASSCKSRLSDLTLGELRRRMSKRMRRDDVAAVWFDVLESPMEDDMRGRTLVECVIELLARAKSGDRLADVIECICDGWSDIGAA